EKFSDIARDAAQSGVAGANDPDAVEQAEAAIHFEAEIGDVGRGSFFENVDERMLEVIGKLQDRFGLPIGGDLLEKQRGKFALQLVGESEIEHGGFVGRAMAQYGASLARVVVAVVIEEHDFTANFGLKAAKSCSSITTATTTRARLAPYCAI